MDYNKLKDRWYKKTLKDYGKSQADIFIKSYGNRYDKFNRTFVHPKLAYSLIDDYHFVKGIGTKWFACVGPGGSGKTTVMKNIFYFLDPTFDNSRVCLKTSELIKNIQKFPILNSMKAVLMDEPDDDLHSSSKGGKMFREVLGKNRQQHLFLGICATDLKDIPPYIFRKVSTVIFCPKKNEGMYFSDNPDYKVFSMQKIRTDYVEKGYNLFYKLLKERGGFRFQTFPGVPLEDEKGYISAKAKDYNNSLKNFSKFLGKETKKETKEKDTNKRTQIIANMRDKGLSYSEIGRLTGLSKTRLHELVSSFRVSEGSI